MPATNDYRLFPRDKEQLLSEIKRAFDDYDRGLLGNRDFCWLIKHYQANYANSFCQEDKETGEIKVTEPTKKRLGKNRSNRLEMVINSPIQMCTDEI